MFGLNHHCDLDLHCKANAVEMRVVYTNLYYVYPFILYSYAKY